MYWVVKRPIATWMITIAIFVFGLVSYQRLALNLMPDLNYPTITIRTEADGYAPEEVEEQVSRKLEEAIATTQGLSHLESRSRAGLSELLLSFHWDTTLDNSIQDVRERIQRVFLSSDIKRPLILRYDPSLDPIIRIALSSSQSLSELREIADRLIKRDLEALDGIAAVRIQGGQEREVQVLAQEDWMAARGISIDNIIQTLASENVNMPAGSILEGDREYLVRTLNAFTDIDDLKTLKVSRSDGVKIPITEVAHIQEGYKERTIISRLNAEEAVELEVYKSADANIVQITNQLKARLFDGEEALEGQLPSHIKLSILEDQASFIESAINNLKNTAFLGAFLAIIILFVFLRNFRATAIIGAAIPLSIVVTFAPMYIGGVSLNLMSLGGLALGIGMLVDNAVVVLENIQVHLDKGKSRQEAAAVGSSEVAMAVTASTLTTISVFLPITFVEGAAGQIFGDLSLAVVFSLLASLVIALFFVPMLAASEVRLPEASGLPPWRERFGSWQSFKKDFAEHNGFRKWIWLLWGIPRLVFFFLFELIVTLCVYPCMLLAKLFFTMGYFIIPKLADVSMGFANGLYAVYQRGESRYQKLLHPVLKKPGTVLGFAFLLFSLSLSQMHRLGQSLLPELNQGRFIVDMELPIGTPLGRTASTILPTEQWLAEHSNVRYVHSILGASGSENRSGVGEHSIRFLIGLNSQERNTGAEKDFMTEIRNKLQSNRKIQNIQFSRPSLFQFQTPIELVLYGDSLKELESKSTDAVRRLSQQNNLTDVRTSLAEGYPEIQIQYDRDRLAKLGLRSSDIARRVREKIQGEKATSISTDESRLDLVVRLTESDRRSVEQLRFLNINPNILPKIPLYTVANIEEKKGPSEIRRVDQQRAVVVTANIDGFDLASPAREIENLFSDLDNWELGGQSEEMRRSSQSMLFAILLAVFLVYVIMASTFESIIHPFVILFTVPLALIGVVAALWLTQLPLSVVVLIGLIVLAGVVVNNAIVLVDTINRKRAGGLSRFEATEEASKLRLRPILITTLTTALGLFPLAFGYGDGAEIQQPLAITIIAGLMSSTLLTLMVIPSLYLFLSKRLERTP